MSEIKEILINLGYQLKEEKDGWRCAAIYRGGDNSTSLKIFSKTGQFIDFVSQTHGTLEDLVKLTLGLQDIKEAKIWLKNKNFDVDSLKTSIVPKIKYPKYFDIKELDLLIQDHSYWINRGISEEVLKKIRGGVIKDQNHKLKNRYVFPIFKENKEDKIIGFAGRSLDPNSKIKWKKIGQSSEFIFPFLNKKNLDYIVITESIGDSLSLITAGISNVLTIFGVELYNPQLSYLLKLNPAKIIISLNNDSNNNNVGNKAAEKVKIRLKRYFDESKLKILLPPEKDWNDLLLKEGKFSIKNHLNNIIYFHYLSPAPNRPTTIYICDVCNKYLWGTSGYPIIQYHTCDNCKK